MRFGLHLLHRGLITAEQFVEALELQQEELVPLGQLAIEMGKLSVRDVFKILRVQSDLPHERFGDTALELDLLTPADVAELLMFQSNRRRPFAQLLVELGVVSETEVQEELMAFRRGMEREGAGRWVRSSSESSPSIREHQTDSATMVH